jgi:hypothetical protein
MRLNSPKPAVVAGLVGIVELLGLVGLMELSGLEGLVELVGLLIARLVG